jgi:hypothetical protein
MKFISLSTERKRLRAWSEWTLRAIGSWNRPCFFVSFRLPLRGADGIRKRLHIAKAELNLTAHGQRWNKKPEAELTKFVAVIEKKIELIHTHLMLAPPPSIGELTLVQTLRTTLLREVPTTLTVPGDHEYLAKEVNTRKVKPLLSDLHVVRVGDQDEDRERLSSYLFKLRSGNDMVEVVANL